MEGVVCPEECLPVGVSALGGVAWGVSAWRCVCLGGGVVCPRGWSLPGGVYPSMHWGRHPPVNRMTDAFKNITLPQLRCGRL